MKLMMNAMVMVWRNIFLIRSVSDADPNPLSVSDADPNPLISKPSREMLATLL